MTPAEIFLIGLVLGLIIGVILSRPRTTLI